MPSSIGLDQAEEGRLGKTDEDIEGSGGLALLAFVALAARHHAGKAAQLLAEHVEHVVGAEHAARNSILRGLYQGDTGLRWKFITGGPMTTRAMRHYPATSGLSRRLVVGFISGAVSVLAFHQPIVNGAWGLGVAIGLALFGRPRASLSS